jgi:hypothetical protein
MSLNFGKSFSISGFLVIRNFLFLLFLFGRCIFQWFCGVVREGLRWFFKGKLRAPKMPKKAS